MERRRWFRMPDPWGSFCFIFCHHFWVSFLSSPVISLYVLIPKVLSVKKVVLHFWADFLSSPGLWWYKTDGSNVGCMRTTGGRVRNCGHPHCSPERLGTPVAQRAITLLDPAPEDLPALYWDHCPRLQSLQNYTSPREHAQSHLGLWIIQ